MIRFSLATLLFIVLLAALAASALKYASVLTLEITETVFFCVLIACTLLAVHGRGKLHRFSSGFALTGWGFLAALFLLPFIGGDMVMRSTMVTETLSRVLYQSMHNVAPPERLSLQEQFATMPMQAPPDIPEGAPKFEEFLRICHTLTGLTLAFCGGVFVCALQMRRGQTTEERERSGPTASGEPF